MEHAQRLRIVAGMADAVHVKGYAGTSVADVLGAAGVSRETFYQLFSSKLDCFLTACDLVADDLLEQLTLALELPGEPLDRLDRAIAAYLDALAIDMPKARLVLVEAHAAGHEAMLRRTALQHRLVDALATLLHAHTDEDRFACQVVVAAISALVAGPLIADDVDALRSLHRPLVDHVHRLITSRSFFPG